LPGQTTKREADAREAEILGDKKKGTHVPASQSPTVAAAGQAWLDQAETDGLDAATTMQYRQHFEHHIKPFIADVRLADLAKPGEVQRFRNRLLKEGRPPTAREPARRRLANGRVEVSQKMAKKVLISLGAICEHALTNGRIGRNPVREHAAAYAKRQRRLEKRHTKRHPEVGVDIPTKDDIRALLTEDRLRWRPLIVTAIFSGLRASGIAWPGVGSCRS